MKKLCLIAFCVACAAILLAPSSVLATKYVETSVPEYTPPANPVVCDTLHEIWPNWCTKWHVVAIQKLTADSGTVTLDRQPDGLPVDFGFKDVNMLTVEDVDSPGDSLTCYPEDAFGALPEGLDSSWIHIIRPKRMFCQRWHIDEVKGNGNGTLDHCDTLIISRGVDTLRVHVKKVVTGMKLTTDPGIPTLTEWGLIILTLMILATMTYVFVKKRRLGRTAA